MKTIAEVIAEHDMPVYECVCGWRATSAAGYANAVVDHAAHVAQAIREARTVRTIEELDALPGGSLIQDSDDEYLIATGKRARNKGHEPIWRFMEGDPIDAETMLVLLPARVLWTPGDEQ